MNWQFIGINKNPSILHEIVEMQHIITLINNNYIDWIQIVAQLIPQIINISMRSFHTDGCFLLWMCISHVNVSTSDYAICCSWVKTDLHSWCSLACFQLVAVSCTYTSTPVQHDNDAANCCAHHNCSSLEPVANHMLKHESACRANYAKQSTWLQRRKTCNHQTAVDVSLSVGPITTIIAGVFDPSSPTARPRARICKCSGNGQMHARGFPCTGTSVCFRLSRIESRMLGNFTVGSHGFNTNIDCWCWFFWLHLCETPMQCLFWANQFVTWMIFYLSPI